MRHYLISKKVWMFSLISLLILSIWSFSSYATGSIEELETESDSLESQLSDVNEEILAINEELEEINQKIELTEAQMGKTLDDLEASLIEEEEQYENMKVRIKYMYENGNSSFLELLFGSESIVDFVNKTDFINNVTEYDREMLEELVAIREDIEFEQANLTEEQTVLLELQEEALQTAEELQQTADVLQVDLDSVLAQIEAVKAEEERLAAEAEAAAAAAAAQNNSSSSSSNSSTSSGTTSSGSDYSASSSELDILAALLDCEAGADYDARLAVATVIMNRVASSKFPNTIKGVIYDSGQFSPTWTGKLDRKLESGASSLSYQVAEAAIGGTKLASVSDCYYFLYAASSSRDGVVIGGNVFFKSW